MVGGIVITTITDGDRIYVNCRGTGCERRETCAIYVQSNADSERIRPGDDIWWHGQWAMWTPADRRFTDRKIPRRGYSGVKSPLARAA